MRCYYCGEAGHIAPNCPKGSEYAEERNQGFKCELRMVSCVHPGVEILKRKLRFNKVWEQTAQSKVRRSRCLRNSRESVGTQQDAADSTLKLPDISKSPSNAAEPALNKWEKLMEQQQSRGGMDNGEPSPAENPVPQPRLRLGSDSGLESRFAGEVERRSINPPEKPKVALRKKLTKRSASTFKLNADREQLVEVRDSVTTRAKDRLHSHAWEETFGNQAEHAIASARSPINRIVVGPRNEPVSTTARFGPPSSGVKTRVSAEIGGRSRIRDAWNRRISIRKLAAPASGSNEAVGDTTERGLLHGTENVNE